MKIGDLVTYFGELGLFLGTRKFRNQTSGDSYMCAEVYWGGGKGIGYIQTSLLRKIK